MEDSPIADLQIALVRLQPVQSRESLADRLVLWVTRLAEEVVGPVAEALESMKAAPQDMSTTNQVFMVAEEVVEDSENIISIKPLQMALGIFTTIQKMLLVEPAAVDLEEAMGPSYTVVILMPRIHMQIAVMLGVTEAAVVEEELHQLDIVNLVLYTMHTDPAVKDQTGS